MSEHFDVLIVGAGISGIGAGYYLNERCPGRSYVILEGRERIGGTWDLFRYPGIRSDSDMYTFGYAFKPWTAPKSIADGDSILEYLNETAEENGIDRHIRFGHHVDRASWSSDAQRWTIEATDKATGEARRFTCGFFFLCSGYYDYEEGHAPTFPGQERFEGTIVHPQKWPEDLDYAGKRVVVIGSGATAVTLVPVLAEQAAHVTMLQRSPTYIVSAPAEDPIGKRLRETFPPHLAHTLARWKNILLSMFLYQFAQRAPEKAKQLVRDGLEQQLDNNIDIDRHFSPPYNPWDQRLCLVPDGDLFKALNRGEASVVTDHIETFTEGGVRLCSGEELEADLIVTATGLRLLFFGGIEVTVDGVAVDASERVSYRGMMLSGVPNLALSFGYTNASWTLKSDLIGEHVCRILNHMERGGYTVVTPRFEDDGAPREPFIGLTSGYVQRSIHILPKQASRAPWKVYQNYLLDLFGFRLSDVARDDLSFR